MTRRLSFWDNSAQEVLRRWRVDLDDNDRGGRSMLRRCASPADAVFVPAYHRLLRALGARGFDVDRGQPKNLERIAAICALAARVDHDPKRKLPRQMAEPRNPGGSAAVSNLRFNRLLAATEITELFPLLSRALQLIDGRADLASLAGSVYKWGPDIRQQWAFDYFDKALDN